MKYWQLSQRLNGGTVRSYGHQIKIDESGTVFVDNEPTEFKSLEEARQHVKQNHISKKLEEEVSKELYEELSEEKVASIIKEHHEVKVTDTLIENYIKLASSNIFSIDPVVQQIRSLNKLDRLIEGKLHYVLSDQSIITISESTQDKLNILLSDNQDVVEYMRESKENFLYVIKKLGV